MLRSGVPVGVLHGGKSQSQRTRVLKAFKDGRATALVATDVAARGIHVDDVSLVVHVDAPADHKDYLHRAGRTARAGATGTVVTLATHKQKRGVFGITQRAAVKLIENQVRPGDAKLQEITGAQEPSGIPIEVEAEKPARSERKPGKRQRSSERPVRDGNFKPRNAGGGRYEPSEKQSFDRKPAAKKAPASKTPAKKSPRMPLEKRIALEKAESRARAKAPKSERSASSTGSSRPGKGFAKPARKGGAKPFKSGKPSSIKRG
jgi:superfamily II DNA/RNA helicase